MCDIRNAINPAIKNKLSDDSNIRAVSPANEKNRALTTTVDLFPPETIQ
jgi:hypothetical protein